MDAKSSAPARDGRSTSHRWPRRWWRVSTSTRRPRPTGSRAASPGRSTCARAGRSTSGTVPSSSRRARCAHRWPVTARSSSPAWPRPASRWPAGNSGCWPPSPWSRDPGARTRRAWARPPAGATWCPAPRSSRRAGRRRRRASAGATATRPSSPCNGAPPPNGTSCSRPAIPGSRPARTPTRSTSAHRRPSTPPAWSCFPGRATSSASPGPMRRSPS